MRKGNFSRSICYLILVFLLSLWAAPIASANKLTVYYDPDSGNVSFDTTNTISGELLIYQFRLFPEETSIRFLPENHISLTSSTSASSSDTKIDETTISNPMKGLLTIGDILPTGISETTWLNLFPNKSFQWGQYGVAGYQPGLGLPGDGPIEYVYGHPEREFDNRWDLVDPDTLDWASAAKLIYRESSGEVFLDTQGPNGGYISGILLNAYVDFLTENFTPPWNSPLNYAYDVRISLLGDAVEPGIYSLGRILESDLSQEEFTSRLESAKFFGKSGLLGDLDLETEPGMAFSLVYVPIPEPTSALLSLLAGTVLLSTRKKTFFL